MAVGGVCDIQYVVLLKAGRRVLWIMSPFSNCALVDFIVLVAFVLVGVSRVHLMDNRIATSWWLHKHHAFHWYKHTTRSFASPHIISEKRSKRRITTHVYSTNQSIIYIDIITGLPYSSSVPHPTEYSFFVWNKPSDVEYHFNCQVTAFRWNGLGFGSHLESIGTPTCTAFS